MTKINTGGSAFPYNKIEERLSSSKGMTLRDYFAAKAMQGIHASLSEVSGWPTDEELYEMAILSYLQADAMVKARGEDND